MMVLDGEDAVKAIYKLIETHVPEEGQEAAYMEASTGIVEWVLAQMMGDINRLADSIQVPEPVAPVGSKNWDWRWWRG